MWNSIMASHSYTHSSRMSNVNDIIDSLLRSLTRHKVGNLTQSATSGVDTRHTITGRSRTIDGLIKSADQLEIRIHQATIVCIIGYCFPI